MAEVIVTIERPILTPQEREQRMALIKEAALRLVIATERAKQQNSDKRKETT